MVDCVFWHRLYFTVDIVLYFRLGPYTKVQTLFPAFSHEPSAYRAPTGEYVVHFTSTAYGCPLNYSSTDTHHVSKYSKSDVIR